MLMKKSKMARREKMYKKVLGGAEKYSELLMNDENEWDRKRPREKHPAFQNVNRMMSHKDTERTANYIFFNTIFGSKESPRK